MRPSGTVTVIQAAGMLVLLALGHAAFAESVYKCRDARGAVAYQDHACSEGTRQTQIEVAAPPPPPLRSLATTSAGSEARSDRPSSSRRVRPASSSRATHSRDHELVSYECRAANGEVFYRHSSCPKSIGTQDIARSPARGKRLPGAGRAEVSAVPLSRSEACRRLEASRGRAGHDRDEHVSTYERNAGRDPCRRS